LKHRNKAALLYGEEYLLDLCGVCVYEVSDFVKSGGFLKIAGASQTKK
jgi:hypothetical protein